jgi:8-oxo-dGTP pyrophosphatase MutT (NUDIX family)
MQLPKREYASAGGVVAAGGRVLVLKQEIRAGPDGRIEMRLPKGHIEPGESRAAAARREVEEEAGLPAPHILADLGHQTVEFDWQGHHTVRDESYFLMAPAPGTPEAPPEAQFERLWLPWEEALARLTYAAEREWLRRARLAWQALQHVADQDAHEADDHPQVQ